MWQNVFIIYFITVSALALIINASPLEKPKQNPCMKACTSDYTPICAQATDAKQPTTFGNQCVLDNYKCESGKSKYFVFGIIDCQANSYYIIFTALDVKSKGECPGNAPVRL